MRKSFYTLIIFLSIVLNDYAQNLVPNPSFEAYTSCPPNLTYLYYSTPWFQPSTYNGTVTTTCSSDFFHSCAGSSSSTAGVPVNILGTQGARTGTGYAGFFVYLDTANAREYIETGLATPLIANKLYCIEFYVSLAEDSDIAISNIGVYFSSDSLMDTSFHAISYCLPQVENPLSNILNDKNNWMLVGGTYIASGGETFITIGNFHDPGNTNYQSVPGGLSWSTAYYYIDDISVVDCDSVAGFGEIEKDLMFNVFPNPNNGNISFQYKVKQDDIAVVKLYDLTGKIIMETMLDPAAEQLKIDWALDNGIYIYQVVVNGKLRKCDKIVIVE